MIDIFMYSMNIIKKICRHRYDNHNTCETKVYCPFHIIFLLITKANRVVERS